MNTEAKIASIVYEYRDVKSTAEMIKQQLGRYRGMLKNLLPQVGGKWQDEHGYARVVEYKPTYSYDKVKVDEVVDRLECRADEEDDPITSPLLRDLAKVLRNCRKPRDGFARVQVK